MLILNQLKIVRTGSVQKKLSKEVEWTEKRKRGNSTFDLCCGEQKDFKWLFEKV